MLDEHWWALICSLVGGLEHFLFFHILGIIIPTDFHIFQRGRLNHQAGGWVVKWVMFGESVLGDCVMIKLDETKPVCGVHPGKWAITSRHTRLAVGSNIKNRCIQHFSVRVCLNMLGSPGNFSWSLLPSGNLLHSYWKWPSRKFVDFPINSMVIFHSFLLVY